MKCEICGKEILRDSQCINYKYYHNNCIENLQQENKKQKEAIDKITSILEYYLIGNLKYQSAQEEFVNLLNILNEVSE